MSSWGSARGQSVRCPCYNGTRRTPVIYECGVTVDGAIVLMPAGVRPTEEAYGIDVAPVFYAVRGMRAQADALDVDLRLVHKTFAVTKLQLELTLRWGATACVQLKRLAAAEGLNLDRP